MVIRNKATSNWLIISFYCTSISKYHTMVISILELTPAWILRFCWWAVVCPIGHSRPWKYAQLLDSGADSTMDWYMSHCVSGLVGANSSGWSARSCPGVHWSSSNEMLTSSFTSGFVTSRFRGACSSSNHWECVCGRGSVCALCKVKALMCTSFENNGLLSPSEVEIKRIVENPPFWSLVENFMPIINIGMHVGDCYLNWLIDWKLWSCSCSHGLKRVVMGFWSR